VKKYIRQPVLINKLRGYWIGDCILLLLLYNTEVLMVCQQPVLAAKLKVKYLITKLIIIELSILTLLRNC